MVREIAVHGLIRKPSPRSRGRSSSTHRSRCPRLRSLNLDRPWDGCIVSDRNPSRVRPFGCRIDTRGRSRPCFQFFPKLHPIAYALCEWLVGTSANRAGTVGHQQRRRISPVICLGCPQRIADTELPVLPKGAPLIWQFLSAHPQQYTVPRRRASPLYDHEELKRQRGVPFSEISYYLGCLLWSGSKNLGTGVPKPISTLTLSNHGRKSNLSLRLGRRVGKSPNNCLRGRTSTRLRES